MKAFFVVWIVGWTGFLVGGTFRHGELAVPVAVDIGMAALASFLFSTKRAFCFREDSLIVVTRWLGLEWLRKIDRTQIKSVKQVKDGGQGGDSFPTWGLQVRAPKRIHLIVRQPYPTSLWLGRCVGQWAEVEFQSASVPEKWRGRK